MTDLFIQTCRLKLTRRDTTSSIKSSGVDAAAAGTDTCDLDSDLDEGSWDALEHIISRQVSKVVKDKFQLEADQQFQKDLLVWFVPILQISCANSPSLSISLSPCKSAVQMSLCHANVSHP